jgi:hypothetical protein
VTTPALDASADTDGDGIPNGVETLLGTNPNSSTSTDSSNQTKLKINTPGK